MPDRYRREIEEILRQAGDLEPSDLGKGPRQSVWRLALLYVKQSLGGKGWSLSPGRVMLIAVSLFLAALVFRAMVPLPGLVQPLAWAGLLLFIVGYAMFFLKPPKIEKRWRGQPLDELGDSWWNRLRRKFK